MSKHNYRVVAVSNHDNEMQSDRLLQGALTESQANRIADILNETVDDFSRDYFTVYPYEKPLYRFEP